MNDTVLIPDLSKMAENDPIVVCNKRLPKTNRLVELCAHKDGRMDVTVYIMVEGEEGSPWEEGAYTDYDREEFTDPWTATLVYHAQTDEV